MIERDEIRDWLRGKLDGAPRGTKTRLAKKLGVAPDAVTRMINVEPGKETRKISAEEHLKMQEFFAEAEGKTVDRPSLIREQAMKVFDDLLPDLQLSFARQLDALAELAAARRNQAPDRQDEQG